MELLLDPKLKLEPLLENGDEDLADAVQTQLNTTTVVESLRRAADNSKRDAHVQLGNCV